MKRLTDHITSAYVAAANRLQGKEKPRRIVAYVESYDDVAFWRMVLGDFETPRLKFQIMLPSQTSLCKGKKLAMSHNLGPEMIACVDADLDYMMQGHTNISKEVCNNPFIVHTFAYAIENYQCYAPNLHEVCVMATLNDREVVDFEAFISVFSEIVHPLFVWLVWTHRHGYHNQFSIQHFAQTVSFGDFNIFHPERTLESVRRNVNKRIATLQRQFPQARDTFKQLKIEIEHLGCTPRLTYLFIQGHTLMDGIVSPMLSAVCTVLRREREKEIQTLGVHEIQRDNELSCYHHAQTTPELIMRKSAVPHDCPTYPMMRARIENIIK